MPSKAGKRKAKAPIDDNDDGFATADEQPKKKPRTSAVCDGAEQADTNRQGQSWAELQTSFVEKDKEDRRTFADDFKKKREERRKTIRGLFKKAAEDIDNVAKNYAERCREACVGVAPSMSPNSKGCSLQDQPLFKTGQTLVHCCRKIITVHEQANDKTTAQGTNHINEKRVLWDKDIAQIEKVLLYSAQLGEKLIACNVQLGAAGEEDREQLLLPPQDSLKGEGKIAVAVHQRSTDGLLNGASTWGEEALLYMGKLVDLAAACETKLGNV